MTCTLHPNVGEVTLETHSKRKGGQYGRQHDAQVGLLASTYTCNCTHMNARVHAHTQKLLPQHLHQLKLNSKASGKIAQMEPCCLVVCFMCIPFILPDTLSDSSRCKPRAEVFSHQPTDTLLSRHLLTVRTRCAGHLHHCPPLWKQSPLGSSSFFSSPSCLLLQGLPDSGRRHSVPSFVLSLFRAHCPGDFAGGHDISCSLCADIGPSSSLSPKPWICMFTVMLTGLLHRGAHWAFPSPNSGLSELQSPKLEPEGYFTLLSSAPLFRRTRKLLNPHQFQFQLSQRRFQFQVWNALS